MPLRKNNLKSLGTKGEDFACSLLENKGYQIIDRNYRTRFAEIDIIAIEQRKHASTLVFVEVKTRRSTKYGAPEEAVTTKKIEKITKASEEYLLNHKGLPKKHRIEVVSIVANGDKVLSANIIKVV